MKRILYKLRVFHGYIRDWFVDRLPLLIIRILNPSAVYLIYTPEHGNLGDHAIAASEIEILDELKIPYIELTGRKLEELQANNCLNIMNGRTILINGGGNLGTLWPSVELMMQRIVQQNPKSKIMILPNTIYYNNSKEDKEKLQRSISIYNAHKQLSMYAREPISYEFMKKIYKNVTLVPDMVFRMNKCKTGIIRKGCIVCLRKDREKTLSLEAENVIYDQIHSIFNKEIRVLDMRKEYSIPVSERKHELDMQFDSFCHAELVVTDRLHGMIFSVITGTPCIVINSKSPKVLGCYEWIKDLPYIKFCEDVYKIELIYRSIPKQEWKYNNTKLTHYYDVLKHDIVLAAKR